MSVYNVRFFDRKELSEALAAMGVDARSLPFFNSRREVKALCIPDIDTRGANVIKQEMLARGGDAAVHAHAVDFGVARSSCLLFGTKKQLRFLCEKLATMPWWGFPQIVEEIGRAIERIDKKQRSISLPGGRALHLGTRMLVMGIVNLTDDSFFAESRMGSDLDRAMQQVQKQVEEGADLLDLGAESTRPGSTGVPEEEEKKRIGDAVREIRKHFPTVPLSIDTTRAAVAREALEAGADIVNDISGLTYDPALAQVAAEYGAMLVLMHMHGTPETMQSMCVYDNLLLELTRFFENGIAKAEGLGLARDRIILDPGIGFAKDDNQNLFLLKHLEAYDAFGLPLLIGASRKATVGRATGAPDAAGCLEGTLAVSSRCAWQGVEIVRVHDVLENKKAVMMIDAIRGASHV